MLFAISHGQCIFVVGAKAPDIILYAITESRLTVSAGYTHEKACISLLQELAQVCLHLVTTPDLHLVIFVPDVNAITDVG